MFWSQQTGLFATPPTYCSLAQGQKDGGAKDSTAYDCHCVFIPGVASPDWDVVAFGGASTSGAGAALPADTVIPAATRIIANTLVAGDTQPAWQVLGSGQMNFGAGGTTATDTNLYRSAAGVLKTDGAFQAVSTVYAQTGTANQVILGYNGSYLSPGIAFGSATDTNLYRAAANMLKTDGSLVVTQYLYLNHDSYSKIFFGTSNDTNLYRAAAGALQTDGTFTLNASGVVRTIEAGAPDSGGAGYRMLRVAN